MKWIPYGPQAVLIQFADEVGAEAFTMGQALVRELESDPPPALEEIVPAYTTLLLRFGAGSRSRMKPMMSQIMNRLKNVQSARESESQLHELPVRYDGEDLGKVCESSGLSEAEVIQLHAETIYTVYLLGFAPGFPYLGELNPKLHTPRHATPKGRVRAGSVAIGGEHTGIYSVDSPGGWNIIGHTSVSIFDPRKQDESMFLLAPGDRVRFIPIDP